MVIVQQMRDFEDIAKMHREMSMWDCLCPLAAPRETSNCLVSISDCIGFSHEESSPKGWVDCHFGTLSRSGTYVVVLLDDFWAGAISGWPK